MSQCSPSCLGCFSSLQFFCLFVCLKKKKRIAEVVGNDLTLPMSAKCGFFTASLGLFFDELLCTRVIKTHLTFSLFISLFLFIFRLLLLWVLAAAFITATVDVSIYTLLSSLGRIGKKKRLYSVAVVAGGSIHYQMQITVTHSADKSSLFSFFKHNNRHNNYVGGFFLLLNVVVSILFLRVSWFLPPLSIFFFFFSVLFQGIEF